MISQKGRVGVEVLGSLPEAGASLGGAVSPKTVELMASTVVSLVVRGAIAELLRKDAWFDVVCVRTV